MIFPDPTWWFKWKHMSQSWTLRLCIFSYNNFDLPILSKTLYVHYWPWTSQYEKNWIFCHLRLLKFVDPIFIRQCSALCTAKIIIEGILLKPSETKQLFVHNEIIYDVSSSVNSILIQVFDLYERNSIGTGSGSW